MVTSADAAGRPRGRDQVRAAVLEVTRDLVAERGVDGFSVRDIADRAGVNHALVHRHFGTKADVLEQVLTAEAEAVADAVAAAGLEAAAEAGGDRSAATVSRLLDVLAGRPTYWRSLVRAVLDDPAVTVPGTRPTTDLFAALWREGAGGPGGAVPSATAGVTVLGWLLFGQFMSEVTGADPEAVQAEVAEIVAGLLGDA